MTYRTRRPRGPWQGHEHGHWHEHGQGHEHEHEHGHWHRHGRRFGSREDLISALERYQRDLEQRAADVAEKIRHLRTKATDRPEADRPDADCPATDRLEADSPEGADATPTTHNV